MALLTVPNAAIVKTLLGIVKDATNVLSDICA